jgi:hypothetical protein
MDARKFGMVSYFAPGEHIAGLRAMKDPEAQLLKDSINAKKRPMYIITMFAVGWGILVLLLGQQMSTNACFISLIMFFIVLVMAGTIRGMVKPAVQALSDHVVLEVSGTCSEWDGTNMRVGPLDIRVPGYLGHIFQEGRTVTVGHLPDTFLGVSVNGVTLPKLLDMSSNGALEVAVKDRLVVWPDMGQGTPQAQAAAYAASDAVSRGRGKSAYLGTTSQPKQAAQQNYIFAKKYQPPSQEPVQVFVSPTEEMVVETPRRYGTTPTPAPGQIVTKTVTVTRTAGCGTQVTEVVKVADSSTPTPTPTVAPTPAPVVEAPKPVAPAPKPPEPKKEPVKKEVHCPYHGTKTELRNGKPWCFDCNNYLDAPPVFCPYHGCRTEPKGDKVFCPRCDAVVEPVENLGKIA